MPPVTLPTLRWVNFQGDSMFIGSACSSDHHPWSREARPSSSVLRFPSRSPPVYEHTRALYVRQRHVRVLQGKSSYDVLSPWGPQIVCPVRCVSDSERSSERRRTAGSARESAWPATSHNCTVLPYSSINVLPLSSPHRLSFIALQSPSIPSTSSGRRLSHPFHDPLTGCFPLFPPMDHDDPF